MAGEGGTDITEQKSTYLSFTHYLFTYSPSYLLFYPLTRERIDKEPWRQDLATQTDRMCFLETDASWMSRVDSETFPRGGLSFG